MDFQFTENAVTLIQLSLAPIFLIVGIGQMVNVATGRLARIVDRARYCEEMMRDDATPVTASYIAELVALGRRMRFSNWAITFLIASAVTVCIDVILILINGTFNAELNVSIIVIFIFSLAFLTFGLAAFFFEVSIATTSLKIKPENFKR